MYYYFLIQQIIMVLLLHIYCLRLVLRLSDGNGFKTSSMRLGADVIVFSRHLNNRFDSDVLVLLPHVYQDLFIYLFLYKFGLPMSQQVLHLSRFYSKLTCNI